MSELARGTRRHDAATCDMPQVKRDGAPGPCAGRPAGATNDKFNSEGHTP
jgi:hypothetical protein